MRPSVIVVALLCRAFAVSLVMSNHQDEQLVQLEGVDLGDLAQLQQSDADIQYLGRELRAQHLSQRKQEIKRGEEMVREGRIKSKLKAEKRISDAESDEHQERNEKHQDRAQYKVLAAQNIKDMQRMVKGHVINAMSNFMGDESSRERENKKTGARRKEERHAKKQRAWEQRWDPVGAGKRERDAKKARSFLTEVKKENAVKSGWSMPRNELVQVAQEGKEEARPMSQFKTNTWQREVPKSTQKSTPNLNKYELMAQQAFKDAKKLNDHAAGLSSKIVLVQD